MANHKSALKRIKQTETKRLLNKYKHKTARNAVRDLRTTIFHPVGTCAMGKVNSNGVAEDLMTVLDSECRVRGISKLRVIDASAMPSITSGNTNAPVMLIAETIVKKILNTN